MKLPTATYYTVCRGQLSLATDKFDGFKGIKYSLHVAEIVKDHLNRLKIRKRLVRSTYYETM